MLPHQVGYLKTDHGYYTYHSCSFRLTGNILMLIVVTGEAKDQTGVHGSQNKSSGASLDASSSVAGAASALVALSTPREKGGR
jgi:hypothetical protein